MALEPRNSNRRTYFNTSKIYKEFRKKRGIKNIKQYMTADIEAVTKDLVRAMPATTHIWEYGDTFQKLASATYGDAEMWWVIAWYNQKPAEFTLRVGDIIRIPVELPEILLYYGY
jgi:nucleoid-associated protein YgaU